MSKQKKSEGFSEINLGKRDKVKFLCCLKIAFMLFSGNLSNDIFGGVISTYFVYAAVLHLL